MFATSFGIRLRSWRVLSLSLAASAILMIGQPAIAIPVPGKEQKLAAFQHTRWTRRDGAPQGIYELAQTPDGFLWLAADEGLLRFDGLRFERMPLPRFQDEREALPTALRVTQDGTLWVGFNHGGGVAVYRNGRLEDTRLADAPPVITDIFDDARGSIWALWGGSSDRLMRYRSGRWWHVDTASGLPPGELLNAFRDRDGTIWMGVAEEPDGRHSIVRLRPGESRFDVIPAKAGLAAVTADPAGALWVADVAGTRRLTDRPDATPAQGSFPPSPGLRAPRVVFDPMGNLWGVTRGSGIFEIDRPASGSSMAKLVHYTAADGLTSDYAVSILRDSEGSIWIGTAGGLDQFRPRDVMPEPAVVSEPRQGLSMAQTAAGTVYIASAGGLYRISPGKAAQRLTAPTDATALCPAGNGSVWLASATRVVRLGDPVAQAISVPGPQSGIGICNEDAEGRLWLTRDSQLLMHDTRGWHRYDPKRLGADDIDVIASSSDGSVAFGLLGTQFGLLTDGRYRRISAQALGIAWIRGISAASDGLLISGSTGIARIRNGQIATIHSDRYPWSASVRNIVQTAQGDTWLYGSTAIYRVRTAAFDRAFEGGGEEVDYALLDDQNGLSERPQRYGVGGSQIAAGADGRLWLLTTGGVLTVEPKTMRRNLVPPNVRITQISAGRQTITDPKAATLGAGISNVTISFAGISLRIPERNQLRYRLEGVDPDWVDPGSRRQAFYTNLSPGTYRFQVIAANDDRIWNRQGAELTFTIPPTFMQSTVFRVLCALALVGLLVGLYALRLRQIAERVNDRVKAQRAERERIARELHDTLLQSMQGLIMRFHGLATKPQIDRDTRSFINATLDQAEIALVQGRDRVADLRNQETLSLDLLIAQFAATLDLPPGCRIRTETDGQERSMSPAVAEEISKIAGEALSNAARHANPSTIDVVITYSRDRLSVRIEDDGDGIDPVILASGREGHFGLKGMRERAMRLGGKLDVTSMRGVGTTVSLSLAAAKAYLRPARWSLFAPQFDLP